MKITGFEIERFGLWTGLAMPKLLAGINVFYGGNEAGKSTLMEFFRTELYGFGEERKRYAKRPTGAAAPLDADVDEKGRSLYVPSGGSMTLDCPSGEYKLRRTFDVARLGHEDQVELSSLDGSKQGNQLLRVLVSGVDEATFNNIFAIGLDELQRLGTLNDTDAAEMLFRMSVGMDRLSIVEAIRELNGKRNRILDAPGKHSAGPNGKVALLPKLVQQREKILTELADARLLVRDYARIRAEQQTVDRAVTLLEEELATYQKEKRLYETVLNATPFWKRRADVREEIAAMGTVVPVPDETMPKLDAACALTAKRRQAIEQLKADRQKAIAQVKAVPINNLLLKFGPRFEVLLDDEKRIVEIDQQITELEKEISSLESQMLDAENNLKQGRRPLPMTLPTHPAVAERFVEPKGERPPEHVANLAGLNRPPVEPEIEFTGPLEDYRVPAKHLLKTRKHLARTKEQHAAVASQHHELNEKINPELAKRNVKYLPEAIERSTEAVKQIRSRQGLAQRLADMAMNYKELHRINAFLVQNQNLPTWINVVIGICVVVGFVLVGIELFKLGSEQSVEISPVFVVLGALLMIGAIAYKFFTDRTNSIRLRQNQRQLSMLLSQLEQAKQEAGAIDARFPPTGRESIEVRVQNAQQDLAHLERLVPVEAERRDVNTKFQTVETRLNRAKTEHRNATKHWADWLKAANLPGDWRPSQVQEMIERRDVVGDLKRELDHRYDLMNQRIREMRGITDRIDRMIQESGLGFADGISYVDILGEVRKRLGANTDAIQLRESMKKGLKLFRAERRKTAAAYRKARREQWEILQEYGVKLPNELRDLHQRHQRYRKLLQHELIAQRELDASIAGFCPETAVAEILEPRLLREKLEAEGIAPLDVQQDVNKKVLPSLDELLKSVDKRIDLTSTKLREELELRGRLGEQLKKLADDQTALRKQRELAVVDEKIEKAQHEWRTYATCGRMLDEIRTTYERERQPRTLAEASEMLRRLTAGKYHRIWTPLGEETLLVDDTEGNSFDVSWLSRGTREQLFIAIRLSLASAFAQHGSVLPMILDDVLVNFDSKRAVAAARVLLEVAKTGRQIFLFTCHEHVCRIFQKMDIPVRILPSIDDPTKTVKVLLPMSILKRREEARRREEERLAAERARRRLEKELADREDSIRRETMRKAEVQRLVLLMQQQATAEKAIEAEREILTEHPSPSPPPPKPLAIKPELQHAEPEVSPPAWLLESLTAHDEPEDDPDDDQPPQPFQRDLFSLERDENAPLNERTIHDAGDGDDWWDDEDA